MKSKLLTFGTLTILVIAVALFITEPAQGQSLTESLSQYTWPMFHHDLNHSGYTDSPAPNTANVLWKYKTDSAITSSPAVVDGCLFIGSHDGYIYSLNSTNGDLIWKYKTGNWIYYSSPAVADG